MKARKDSAKPIHDAVKGCTRIGILLGAWGWVRVAHHWRGVITRPRWTAFRCWLWELRRGHFAYCGCKLVNKRL